MGCVPSKPSEPETPAPPGEPPVPKPPTKPAKSTKRAPVTPSIREQMINIHAKVSKGTGGHGKKEAQPERLRNIFAAPLKMVADFVAPVHVKTPEQIRFIDGAVSDNFVFSSLSLKERRILIQAMEAYTVPNSGTTIIQQGETGDYFYIVETGAVDFQVNGAAVGQALPGHGFGELALLYDCPRAATCITAKANTKLWRVDQVTFRQILASGQISQDAKVKKVLQKVPFLKDLDEFYLSQLADGLTQITFSDGEIIVKKGASGDVFYIIESGQVKVTDIEIGDSKYSDQILKEGDYFGERAIITEEPRVANIKAHGGEVVVFALSRADFEKYLGSDQDLGDLISKSNDSRQLKAVPLFGKSQLENYEKDMLAKLLKDTTYKAGTVLITEGEEMKRGTQAIYWVRSGKVQLTSATSGGVNTILSEGGYFGEDYLTTNDDPVFSKVTVKVLDDAECTLAKLTMASIVDVIADKGRLSPEKKKLASKLDKSIAFTDLKKHRILGVGTFGQVWLVSSAKPGMNKKAYALKIQSKRELIMHGQVDGVIREKEVMASIDHPFILKLVNTYQDPSSLYMLLELVQGGELFSLLHPPDAVDGVPECSARFYAACILEGLSYMHQRKILYRDLKPENVLIDADGYPVIVDLGFAKIVPDKTYTLCGTPLYLAPEVILSRGHDKGADHWSWAVLVYEMIIGTTPFYEDNIDQISLFKKIVHGKWTVPDKKQWSSEAHDLVERMIKRRPNQRLGGFVRGDLDIKEHAFFTGEKDSIDFTTLASKTLTAPWKPKLKNALDVSNFDNWDHMQKDNKKDKKLSSREQSLFDAF